MSKDPRAYYQMDVGYLDNPKVESLVETHPRAVLLHQACIAYAAQHLTDGLVPLRPAMRRACAEAEDLAALVDNGLLVDNGDGKVIVHDYLKHNRSAAEAKKDSDKARRAAAARWDKEGDAPSNARSIAPSMPDALPVAVPDAMPDAMPREREREKETPPTVESRARRARTLPEGWRPSDETAKAIKREVPGIDLTAEHAKFVDHWTGNGKAMKDWEAVWRNWMRRAPQFQGRNAPTTTPTRSTPTADETCSKPGHSGWANNCAQCRADTLAGTTAADSSELRPRNLAALGLIGRKVE